MAVEVAMGTISRPADDALREQDRQRELPTVHPHSALRALATPTLTNAATQAGFGPSRSCSLRCPAQPISCCRRFQSSSG